MESRRRVVVHGVNPVWSGLERKESVDREHSNYV